MKRFIVYFAAACGFVLFGYASPASAGPDTTPPTVLSSAFTAPNTVTIRFSEPVTGYDRDFGGLFPIINHGRVLVDAGFDDSRTVIASSGNGTDTILLNFDGPPVTVASTGHMRLNEVPTSIKDLSGNELVEVELNFDYEASTPTPTPTPSGHTTGGYLSAEWRAKLGFPPLPGQPTPTPVPTPSAVAPPPFVFTRFLSRGSTGEEVRELQLKLKALGFFPVDVDATGFYGPITEAAVKAFQTAHGISPLGIVGPLTRAALNK